jgi:mannose-6-phosphate isomerase-like protein (cupin superfamily)
MITGKVWGESELIKASSMFELHRISVYCGGYCSKHKHETKWNGFLVESGELEITVWQPSGLIDITILTAGQYTDVPPGVFHRFAATEQTVAFELYWAEMTANDIIREGHGGLN